MTAPGIAKIGVIGAGQMGSGIAQVCAVAGYTVSLYDIEPAQLDAARLAIAANLDRRVERGTLSEAEKAEAVARIVPVSTLGAFADCGLVIEAASEDEAVKRDIFAALCPALGADALIATNTSSISITRLAAATDRPERFMGMHFMNPVPVMELVELIRGMATDTATFEAVRALALELGKTVVVAEDFPAFLVNRVMAPMINEAIYALYEGWARWRTSTTRYGSGSGTRWGRCNSPTTSGSTPASPSSRSCARASPIRNTGRARYWSSTSRPAGWAAKPDAASTTTPAKNRCPRAKRR